MLSFGIDSKSILLYVNPLQRRTVFGDDRPKQEFIAVPLSYPAHDKKPPSRLETKVNSRFHSDWVKDPTFRPKYALNFNNGAWRVFQMKAVTGLPGLN
jgi:hypothetical protein